MPDKLWPKKINKGSYQRRFLLRLAVIVRKGEDASSGEALGGDKHRESFPKVVQSRKGEVTGTLNKATKTIHITEVKAAS